MIKDDDRDEYFGTKEEILMELLDSFYSSQTPFEMLELVTRAFENARYKLATYRPRREYLQELSEHRRQCEKVIKALREFLKGKTRGK